jgi:XRE family transcriptional regulator, regulator of sulfur utilization
MSPVAPKLHPAAAVEPGGSEFGERMRTARRTRGLTLREVSEATGISVTYLSDLERGTLTNPTLDKLVLIGRALKVPIAQLVGADEEVEADTPEIPDALAGLTRMPQFREAIAVEAKRWRTTPAVVEREWLKALQRISVLGHRPRETYDYLFVFEAARRAIEEP